jgi:cytochrome c biogenesis protein ResB
MGSMQQMMGFRKPIRVMLKTWEPTARDISTYVPSRVQYGDQAPPPAVRLKNARGESVWIGFSERRMLTLGDRPIELEFMPRFSILPFALKLERFEISRYEGTMDPSAYRSHVRVESEVGLSEPTEIAMNQPLKFGGFTFYQASFIPGTPRPTTTVLSVNRDPGRPFKYWGSIVMVLGAILLFARKYKKLANRDLFPSQTGG